jgi:hypothetical protein
MAMVMIRCPTTGNRAFTGIETVPESVNQIPPINARVVCPRCGQTHVWSILDAELVSEHVKEPDELPRALKTRLAKLLEAR